MKSDKKTRKTRAKRGGSSLNYTQVNASNSVANTPSFQGIPIRYFYDMNDYNSDPNNPSVVTNARLSGGRSRRQSKKSAKSMRKTRKHRQRRQRGGFNVFSNTPFLGTASYNIPASFGSIPFSYLGSDIIAGSTTPQYPQNPSTIQQPAEAKYNTYHPPLA
jgi:hypothetical protein